MFFILAQRTLLYSSCANDLKDVLSVVPIFLLLQFLKLSQRDKASFQSSLCDFFFFLCLRFSFLKVSGKAIGGCLPLQLRLHHANAVHCFFRLVVVELPGGEGGSGPYSEGRKQPHPPEALRETKNPKLLYPDLVSCQSRRWHVEMGK